MASALSSKGKYRKGGRSKKEDNPQVILSKRLTWILRHKANEEGINITPSGYVKVKDLLNHDQFKQFTVQDIRIAVEQNDKQRFSLQEDLETGDLLIRANQGHSVETPDLELVELKPTDVPTAVHGTYRNLLSAIRREGLSKMNRQHIHMAENLPESGQVISGMRCNCNAVIHIDVTSAITDGIKFFRSKNNVILSSGNDKGYIPPKYFIKITER